MHAERFLLADFFSRATLWPLPVPPLCYVACRLHSSVPGALQILSKHDTMTALHCTAPCGGAGCCCVRVGNRGALPGAGFVPPMSNACSTYPFTNGVVLVNSINRSCLQQSVVHVRPCIPRSKADGTHLRRLQPYTDHVSGVGDCFGRHDHITSNHIRSDQIHQTPISICSRKYLYVSLGCGRLVWKNEPRGRPPHDRAVQSKNQLLYSLLVSYMQYTQNTHGYHSSHQEHT